MATATALEPSLIVRSDGATMIHLLRDEPEFSGLFTAYLLSRNVHSQADLVDHLFNSSIWPRSDCADPPVDGPLWEGRPA